MAGHPKHGTRPLAAKLRVEAKPSGVFSNVWLWKLRRPRAGGGFEIHPTAGGLGPTWSGTESMARATAGAYPGWELVHA